MISAYIVDDEPLARDELKYLLNRSKLVQVIGEGDQIETALFDINTQKPDIVFIDIQLDGENGLNLAKKLEVSKHKPAICFATAYDEYAIQAFETNAFDYILKPFDEERIRKTIEKVLLMSQIGKREEPTLLNLKNEGKGKLAINTDEKIVLIAPSDIIYLESTGGKCIIKTLKKEITVLETLVGLEKKLKKPPFVRVHRSYIVNIDFIMEIEPWFNSTHNLIMQDHTKIPVSRTYIKELKSIVGF